VKTFKHIFCDRIRVKKKIKFIIVEERKLKMNSGKNLKNVSKQVTVLLVVLLVAVLATPTVWGKCAA